MTDGIKIKPITKKVRKQDYTISFELSDRKGITNEIKKWKRILNKSERIKSWITFRPRIRWLQETGDQQFIIWEMNPVIMFRFFLRRGIVYLFHLLSRSGGRRNRCGTTHVSGPQNRMSVISGIDLEIIKSYNLQGRKILMCFFVQDVDGSTFVCHNESTTIN